MGCTQSQSHQFPLNFQDHRQQQHLPQLQQAPPPDGESLQFVYNQYEFDEEFTYLYRSCTRLAKKYMDRLPTVRLEHDASQLVPIMDDECLICFAPYCRGATLVSLPCGHCYHKECLQEWFCRQCTCPYCRYEMGQSRCCQDRMSLVDVLLKRQEELRHLQHRKTVLDQLSFSTTTSSSSASIALAVA